ncbi:Lrp/AsnC family transcriptional regulator [Arsenicicoccus dermatophilus]|uniref:Lrp/AsnC family transcriptional regulator n=1 Tax=Arsenicicoccus dermatophilus TaxID=1076331 RepID=UPI001F4CDE37|nr:Lrp/AsnC family transcriptional regulator [Arsenicicoccus dermatophilus]MCH8613525.1 Lrp/AsnC family transcriptional regulator [Arsenicicoccus dermatophilus]
MGIDDLDRRILHAFTADPHLGVLGAARQLGVARGTIQSRLDRLQERGVIRSLAPTVDPAALGYPVMAFVTLEIRQDHGHERVVAELERIPEVLEAHTITGSGDIWIRLVGRDNADVQRVLDDAVAGGSVIRTTTVISLATRLATRTTPLVDAAVDHAP